MRQRGRPVVRLVAISPQAKRELGSAAGQITWQEGWHLPLTDAEMDDSAASIWEIQLKRRAGKLTLPDDPSFLPGHLRRLGVRETIAVAPEHTYRVATLPLTHRDPFDCLLAAQCLSEGLALLSVDPAFASLGVSALW